MHIIDHLYEDYHDARSLEHKVLLKHVQRTTRMWFGADINCGAERDVDKHSL
jgi:hypothetical protein